MDNKIIILIAIVFVFILLMFLTIGLTTKERIVDDRAKKCLKVYDDSDYNVNFGNITMKFNNPFYENQEMYHFLRDYYIASSYKSYLACGHTSDMNSYNAIARVIEKGARLIHLDIYMDKFKTAHDTNAVPVVSNGKNFKPTYFRTSAPLNLKKCFKVIEQTAWDNNNYPLFLFLDLHIHNNKMVQRRIANTLLDVFSNRLIDKRYGFQRHNLGSITINNILNRIVILTSSKPTDGALNELVNGTLDGDDRIRNMRITEETERYGGVKSVNVNNDEVIMHNRYNLQRVYLETEEDSDNITNPKVDVINPTFTDRQEVPFADARDLGIQFICMNYQKLDDNMRNYVKFFSDCSFVVKPVALRFIPSKPLPVFAKNPLLYYDSRNTSLSERPGFMSRKF